MPKLPEQLNMERQEGLEQEVNFGEQNLLEPSLIKNIHEAADVAREEEQKNPEKLVALRKELDKIFGSVSPENVQELLSDAEKQDYWEKTMEDLDQVGDKLNKPIDRGVKETVAAFMVEGLPTQSSCEGHVEKRGDKTVKLSPYVDIGKGMPDIRYVAETEIRQKIAEQFGITPNDLEKNDVAQRAYWDYIANNNVKETPEYLSAQQENEKLKGAVDSMLDDFYKERLHVKRRISTESFGENFRVTTNPQGERNGVEFKKSLEVAEEHIPEAKKELAMEQEEFKDFTAFMKDRYFGAKQ